MKNPNQGTTAVSWTRVSSEDQGQRYSLEAQQQEIDQYAETNKITLIRKFTCTGSGFNFENPELQELLDYLQDNKDTIDLVIFTEQDRLMRDPQISGYIKYTCLNNHIKMIGINDRVKDADSETQELTDNIMVAVKKFEVMRKTRRCQRGVDMKFKNGRHIGKAPLGYETITFEGRKILRPSAKAIDVQNMFKDYLKKDNNGEKLYGYWRLAVKYSILNIKEKPMPITVRSMLHNPIYIGLVGRTDAMTKEKVWIKGRHTPIIDTETFSQIKGNEKYTLTEAKNGQT